MRSTAAISQSRCAAGKSEEGFSLIETIIALLVLMITVMGIFGAITYSTVYNSSNSRRSQALSVMQQEVELLRSLKFNPLPAVVDPNLAGGVKPTKTVTAADNSIYSVNVTIDDDPFTAGVQTDATKTLKEITVTVTPMRGRDSWVNPTATRVILRRVLSN